MNGVPRCASSASTGRWIVSTSSSTSDSPSQGTGEYEPMPPVFGPVSPSPTRLKSCAGASGMASRPSVIANSETSWPSSSSSITGSPPSAATARSPASTSGSVRQTKTPFPAARPSALTTHGGRAVSSLAGSGDAGCLHDLLGEALRAFDSRGRRARAEDRDSRVPKRVGDPGDERHLGADDHEVDAEGVAQVEEALRILRAHRMALAEACDARVPGRGVERCEPGALGELPGECVLAPPRADDEDSHGSSLLGESARFPPRTRLVPGLALRALGPVVRFARPPPRGDRNQGMRTCL